MPHTLLLADDSVTIQRVIELTFADEDIRVVAVGDGDQAIAFLDKTPPDIVLADIGMPGKSGYEVAAHMRDTPWLAHIPIVLLAGAFEPVDQIRAKALGCDGVLAKPFEPQLVISRVKELLATPKAVMAPQVDEPLPPPLPPPPAPPWPAVFEEPATVQVAAAAPPGPPPAAQYFDSLDAAFANLSNTSRPEPVSAPPAVVEEADWFNMRPAAAPAVDIPLTYAPPPLSFTQPAPIAAPPAPLPPPAPPPSFPPLADAFAALLAAEQSAPPSAAIPAWPAPQAPAPPVPEDIIEEVTRRVLDRLSDRVVRETVSDIVSSVAERLVREEIERIKSSIK